MSKRDYGRIIGRPGRASKALYAKRAVNAAQMSDGEALALTRELHVSVRRVGSGFRVLGYFASDAAGVRRLVDAVRKRREETPT